MLRTFIFLAAASFASGCATIVSGSSQDVSFNSTPPGASISVDGVQSGVTPSVLKLDTGTTHAVVLSIDGYNPYSINLKREVNGWVWGNLLVGGLIGLVIDASTGAMYRLSPEEINAGLSSTQEVGMLETDDALLIAVVMEADPTWRRVGQLQMQN